MSPRLLLFAVGCLLAAPLAAHPLAPALLELEATGTGSYSVTWRLSALQPPGVRPVPALPSHCVRSEPGTTAVDDRGAVATRWRVDCGPAGLAGATLAVDGLDGINAIVRVRERDGWVAQGLVDASAPRFVVPAPDEATPVFPRYLTLGVEHLVLGPDHLLFVLALVLLVRLPGRLVLTLTSFTLGHSLTLALVTLGLVRVSPALMELGIALSLVVVARELLRQRPSIFGRRPGFMALAFGLLHGMGFAGALGEVGLPAGEIPLALLAFNLGIELGQLALVAAVFATALALRLLPRAAELGGRAAASAAPAYAIGGMAMLWCIERLGPAARLLG